MEKIKIKRACGIANLNRYRRRKYDNIYEIVRMGETRFINISPETFQNIMLHCPFIEKCIQHDHGFTNYNGMLLNCSKDFYNLIINELIY